MLPIDMPDNARNVVVGKISFCLGPDVGVSVDGAK